MSEATTESRLADCERQVRNLQEQLSSLTNKLGDLNLNVNGDTNISLAGNVSIVTGTNDSYEGAIPVSKTPEEEIIEIFNRLAQANTDLRSALLKLNVLENDNPAFYNRVGVLNITLNEIKSMIPRLQYNLD